MRRKHHACHEEIKLGLVVDMDQRSKSFHRTVPLLPEMAEAIFRRELGPTKFVDLEGDLSIVHEVLNACRIAECPPLRDS